MENSSARQAAQAILDSCQEKIGQKLEAAYLFGSLVTGSFQPGESDVNLLMILSDWVDLHELRQAYAPVWLRHRDVLGQSPVFLDKSGLSRYLSLHPVLAEHLLKHGRLLAGDDCLEKVPPPAPLEPLSRLAGEVMAASAAVAPQLLQPGGGQRLLIQLRRLFRQTTGQPAADEMPAAELVGQLTQDLVRQCADLPDSPHTHLFDSLVSSAPAEAPALLPQLRAIYEIEERLILVFPDQPVPDMAGLINHIDWPAVADSVGQHYFSLHIVTPNLLRLYQYYDASAAHFFGRYVHAWGNDLLGGLDIPLQMVVRDLARRPAEISAVALPHAYLTADDDELPRLIHDFQNKLLNIQLQQELFARIVGQARALPPQPLPGRETSPTERIDAILNQLDWWADYFYASLLTATAQPAN